MLNSTLAEAEVYVGFGSGSIWHLEPALSLAKANSPEPMTLAARKTADIVMVIHNTLFDLTFKVSSVPSYGR